MADGGRWGFVAGGVVIFVHTEYKWGIGWVDRGGELRENRGSFDKPMAKLLTVLLWPYIGGGEADPRRRRTV